MRTLSTVLISVAISLIFFILKGQYLPSGDSATVAGCIGVLVGFIWPPIYDKINNYE